MTGIVQDAQLFVWLSYAAALALPGGLWWMSWLKHRRVNRQLFQLKDKT